VFVVELVCSQSWSWPRRLLNGGDPTNPRRGNLPDLAGANYFDGLPSPISQHA
jgi:hypothetical protein